MESNIISLQQISKSYSDKRVLSSINLDITENTFNVIMGDSGCGKSTLLNIIGLIDFSNSGKYYLMGNEVNSHSSNINNLRNKIIGYIFQSYCLIPNMTVYDNVIVPLLYRNCEIGESLKKVDDYLKDLNIYELKNKKVDDLSGGEKQRVAICRILVADVKIVLADEPTGNLDEKNKIMIAEMFNRLVSFYKKTVIIVTHDKSFKMYSDKCYTITDGVIYEDAQH